VLALVQSAPELQIVSFQHDHATLLPDDGYAELQRVAQWASSSRDGLRQELDPPPRAEVWDMVSADSSSCARKYCDGAHCFYQRARARL